MSGWRWNSEKGWYPTGITAAAEKNKQYREQFGLTEDEYNQALSNPVMALAIIEQLYADPSISWVEATVRAMANPLLEVAGFTPFDVVEEVAAPDPAVESERLKKRIGEMLLSR